MRGGRNCGILFQDYAGMAELADALDLGSSAARHAGSTPVTRTIIGQQKRCPAKNPDFIGVFRILGAKFLKIVL